MIRFFALGILALILFSCDDESVAYNELKLNQSNAIHIFETKTSVSNELSITMDAILSDSRCPEGAICIWEGNAMVRYMISRNNQCDTIILNTHGSDGFPSDTALHSLTFNLQDVTPYPHTNQSIPYNKYTSKLIITGE